jgi:hypothetical protein
LSTDFLEIVPMLAARSTPSALQWIPRAVKRAVECGRSQRRAGLVRTIGKARLNPGERAPSSFPVTYACMDRLTSSVASALLGACRGWHKHAGTTNTIKYYYCMRLAASFAGVAKPGQRRWIQGPVTKVFVGSNPIPRIILTRRIAIHSYSEMVYW